MASPCRPSCRGYCEYPCPCGFAGDPEKECTCSPTLISRYQKRLSGPLLDRIDIHIEVSRVPFQKLSDDRRGEPSAAIRARVEAARARQAARFAAAVGAGGRTPLPLTTNADTGPEAERVLIDLLRQAPASRKLEMLGQLNAAARRLALQGLRARHPDATETQLQRYLADLLLGPMLAARSYGPLPSEAPDAP